MQFRYATVALMLPMITVPVIGQAKAKTARELAEWLIGRSSKEAVEAGADRLARRIVAASVRGDDNVLVAVEKANMPG